MTTIVNTTAETAVIAALMQNPNDFEKVAARVPVGSFNTPLHREVYKAITLAVENSGVTETPYDSFSIACEVEKYSTELSPSGENCFEYLLRLATGVPVGSLSDVIGHLTEAYSRTNASRIIEESALAIKTPGADMKTVVATVTSELGILLGQLDDTPVPVRGIAEIADDTIQKILEGGGEPGLPTGYTELDELLDGGMMPGALYVVGARPGVGKSAFGLDAARHLTMREKKNVLFLNLEMRPQDLFIRFFAAEKNIRASRLSAAMKSETGAAKDLGNTVAAAYATLMSEISLSNDPLSPPAEDKGNLWVWSPYAENHQKGGSRHTVGDVGALLATMHAAGNVDVLIVDYLQLLEPAVKSESRQNDVASTVRALKEMALRNNIPIVLLSQVNRGSAERADKRPMLSDLRESGEIEQAADAVIILHNESKARGEDPRESMLDVILAKNRHGRDGSFQLATELDYCRFANLASSGSTIDY